MILLFRKRVSVEMMELRVLRWEGYPGLSGWVLNEIRDHRRETEANRTQTEEKATGPREQKLAWL